MKEMDCVEVIAEKTKYAKYGIHKGMQGWICMPENIGGTWLVNFPRYGEKDDIETAAIDESDLRLLPDGMDARINEAVEARFNASEAAGKPSACGSDLSGYMLPDRQFSEEAPGWPHHTEGSGMKEMDCVEVTAEKARYARRGVHKGMQGWICNPEKARGTWLVDFPRYGEKDDIAMLAIDEGDLRLLPDGVDARINEAIEARFADSGDLSGYML